MKKLIFILVLLPISTLAQCWQSIDTGVNHTLAIKNDGKISVWGYLTWGTESANNTSDLLKVSAGNWHSAGIKINGKLWTWGNNFYGQCGNDTILKTV